MLGQVLSCSDSPSLLAAPCQPLPVALAVSAPLQSLEQVDSFFSVSNSVCVYVLCQKWHSCGSMWDRHALISYEKIIVQMVLRYWNVIIFTNMYLNLHIWSHMSQHIIPTWNRKIRKHFCETNHWNSMEQSTWSTLFSFALSCPLIVGRAKPRPSRWNKHRCCHVGRIGHPPVLGAVWFFLSYILFFCIQFCVYMCVYMYMPKMTCICTWKNWIFTYMCMKTFICVSRVSE